MPRLIKQDQTAPTYLNKADIIRIMADKFPDLSHHDIKTVVDTLIKIKTQLLASGRRIELRGVGTFFVKVYEERVAFNPKTNTRTRTPERRRVQFKPGKLWRESINAFNLKRQHEKA